MAFVNYNNKEITIKIVYYGPALSGKTTCLKYIYSSNAFKSKGKLITLDTDGDRTLFFDFLPLEIGKLGNYAIKIQLYTVPGQVSYNTTRKLVLQGADGVVFVADSQVAIRDQNIDSYKNLMKNLELNKISPDEIPIILQYNKRDLKEILPIDDLNKDLNPENKSFFPTVATNGENILEALSAIMKMVIVYLRNKLSIFQKDKTVMFSREEITSKSPQKKRSKKESKKIEPEFLEDTEKEEVFELSKPFKENSDEGAEAQQDEDVFKLEDESILEQSDISVDIPEIDLSDVISDDSKTGELGDAKRMGKKKSIEEKSVEKEILLTSEVQDFNIPIDLKIPDDKDEIRVNLNLHIVLRKK